MTLHFPPICYRAKGIFSKRITLENIYSEKIVPRKQCSFLEKIVPRKQCSSKRNFSKRLFLEKIAPRKDCSSKRCPRKDVLESLHRAQLTMLGCRRQSERGVHKGLGLFAAISMHGGGLLLSVDARSRTATSRLSTGNQVAAELDGCGTHLQSKCPRHLSRRNALLRRFIGRIT
jgi:hypothetical protein